MLKNKYPHSYQHTTITDAQNAKYSDVFEETVVTTNALNVMLGDQDTPLPVTLLKKKGITRNGRKNGKKHQLSGKSLTERLMKKRRNL